VTATYDSSGRVIGYHSNRRCPARSAVEAVSGIYQALLAEEQRHSRAPEALNAGTALMMKVLGDAGVNYNEFFWSVTP